MSKLFYQISVLLALIFSFTLNPINAPNDNCGTPDLPWPQYQNLPTHARHLHFYTTLLHP